MRLEVSSAPATANTIETCIQLLRFKTITDPRGQLSVVEAGSDIPFVPKRFYYMHSLEHGAVRGGHAHKALQQCLIVMSGAARISISDGLKWQAFELRDAEMGLYIRPVVWREIVVLAPGTTIGVLASELFDEKDYIRDYDEFRKYIGR